MYSTLSTLNTLSKAPNPQLLTLGRSINGCSGCMCVHCCVCALWMGKCRARIPSMGHHTSLSRSLSIAHGLRNQTTSNSLIMKLVFFKGHVPDLEHQAEQAWYRHGETGHPCHNNCKLVHKHLWPHIVQGSVQAVEAHLISAVWTDRRGGKGARSLHHLQVQLPCGFILRVFLGHRTHDEVRVQRSHCWKLLLGGVLLCHTWATLTGCKHCMKREKI